MQFSITELISHMSLLQKGIWISMLIMSIWTLAITIERYMRFKKAKDANSSFVSRLGQLLNAGDSDKALAESKNFETSPVAQVIGAGLTAQKESAGGDVAENVYRALDRAKERQTANLRSRLGSLGTMASIAPFVGLLGTVVGIIAAFTSMENGTTIQDIGPGIAEALYATAFGLIIAIPAAMLFNYFTNKVDAAVVDMNEVSSEFVDYVLK